MTPRSIPNCMLILALIGLFAVESVSGQLQSPAEYLGYELGTHFTRHHQVIDYFEHVGETSARVAIEAYGVTNEGRELIYAVVGTPENMSRIEEIRSANLRLAFGPESPAPSADVAIVWLSYGVHGSESVSTEAAMATLFELADPKNSQTTDWLSNTIVIIVPCLNPDGRDRYVNWFNQVKSRIPDIDPMTREHRQPWPGGRTNHYLFDLNRDWAWATQKETRYLVKAYQEWLPHIHVDFHEQGINSPYYFAPGAEPLHENITDWQRTFQKTVAANHAKYFDENGWLYFTGEVFDLLYPGYGDTWPMFHGGIGMTYEQAGGGSAGLAVRTETGDTLTLGDRIAHHHTTGLSTVEVASDNRSELLREFAAFFADARTKSPGEYESYVISANNDADKIDGLRRLLDMQGIVYGQPDEADMIRGFSYGQGRQESYQLNSSDLVVPARQPYGTFVKVLFEPSTLVADSVTYDITSWSIPYVYGLEAYASANNISISPMPEKSQFEEQRLESAYAYLSDWTSFEDARLVSGLAAAGIKTRFSMEPFTVNGKEYPAGSIIALRGDNIAAGDFSSKLLEVTERLDQPMAAVASGLVEQGSDFGSSNVRYMEKPLVATVAGDAVSSYGFGEIWYYFEQELSYPISVIDIDDFNSESLREVDLLILPDGSYGGIVSDELRKGIRDWIRRGGTLIALERAVNHFAGKEGFSMPKSVQAQADTTAVLRKYGDRNRSRRSTSAGGSVYRVDLDNSHPLAFGYSDEYFTLKRSSSRYPFSHKVWNVGTIAANGYVTGFSGAKAKERLQDVVVFGVEDIGSGHVVYMIDNPLFRGFWENGKLLFANAVFRVGH